MTGFTTMPDAIRAAAKATENAVTALKEADCGTPVGTLADALPGSAAAGAAASYAQSWTTAFTHWCNQADQHGTSLNQVAANYGDTENVNTRELDPYGSENYNIQQTDQHTGTTRGPH
jgi:hypothetical protein